ncbi:hypothetical protein A7K50_03255 [Dehalobacter sp. MCB1]|uniref:hypothetical protein n=1 Tax=Dehalobacter sp. MCB1 TaxID=1844756 RepID=UPI000E6BFF4A|nr:hypothetical protein [Dehalobacter sp. MCB1]RJE47679.1 hypothetical protein A7K50_03255 [Dehalobacter sp. MCB1]
MPYIFGKKENDLVTVESFVLVDDSLSQDDKNKGFYVNSAPQEEFIEGKVVIKTYLNLTTGVYSFDYADKPVEDSEKITQMQEEIDLLTLEIATLKGV